VAEENVHRLSLEQLVKAYHSGSISEYDILHSYGKRAYAAQMATNCLTDVMIADVLTDLEDKKGSSEGDGARTLPLQNRPLAGVPVSIKDSIDVFGCPTTLGYAARASSYPSSSAAIVRLLHDAGALMHVKTTVPTGVFGLETASALFGRTAHPTHPTYSPGASTGGGGALLAQGGSIVEVGTDIGGSVRLPAAFCGLYALKASVGRFPCTGAQASTPGLEAIPTVVSPLARRLDDLRAFCERVIKMQPWDYDHSVGTCALLPASD